MADSRVKTAGIIIIGNEILSGKVHDSNSFFLASELRELGVNLERIVVIPDVVDIIGREAREFSGRYDYVFTSGGVGPTHDDVTMEGIAKGFGVALIEHTDVVKLFKRRYGDSLNEAILKMAIVPEGAEVIDVGNLRFPLAAFKNIFIFPGIPEYLREKFASVKERFRSSSFYLKRIFINANESDIALMLNKVVSGHAEVSFGSYPILGNPEYKIIVTADSKSEESLNRAVKEFLGSVSEKIIVRIE